MSLDACLVIHPYTARPDVGLGHDRYAHELHKRLPAYEVTPRLLETGFHRTIPAAMLAEGRAIWRLMTRSRAAVYHATATINAQSAITARTRPLVTTIHDVLWFFVGARYDSQLKRYLKTRAIRRAAHHSDAIIVPFATTADFLAAELGTPRERIQVIPYGVDHDRFYPQRNGEALPRPSFFPRGGKVILFVGALTHAKGVDTLLRAFPAIAARVPDAQLLIGSSGAQATAIRELHASSPVRDRIQFTGFIPESELRAAYAHADVMAFPSRYGFGLSTLESMACGTPTVSGRTLDAPEMIGDAGLMADPNNPDELAHQITRILCDATLSRQLTVRGIETAARYRWDRMVFETANLYRRICGRVLLKSREASGAWREGRRRKPSPGKVPIGAVRLRQRDEVGE
jgi:glycosyltransferase involved in cell wall biosynthesis